MRVEIRPFRPGDEVGISIAHARSIREICSKDYGPEVIAAWIENIKPERYLRSHELNRERYWVADVDGTIVGLSGSSKESIRIFYMHPEYVGRGFGRQLFEVVERDFWQLSGRAESLISATITAKPFYERMGYMVIGPGQHTFPSGAVIDVWHLRKERPATI